MLDKTVCVLCNINSIQMDHALVAKPIIYCISCPTPFLFDALFKPFFSLNLIYSLILSVRKKNLEMKIIFTCNYSVLINRYFLPYGV